MKIIYRFASWLLPAALLLSGCSSLWEREIYERTAHLAQEDGGVASAALTVNSYGSLKAAVISVIRSGESEAGIRVTDYPGGLTKPAVSAMLAEIQKWEPIGAYAVEYIDFDYTNVLSQYTITLNIVYRPGSSPDIAQVSGRRALEEAVHSALRDYRPSLTVEMRYYYAQEHDVESMVRSFYYDNPVWAMEYPQAPVSLYPSSGNSLGRIIELELGWQTAANVLMRKAQATERAANVLLENLPGFAGSAEENTAQAVLWLHDALCETIRYDEETAMLAVTMRERQGIDPYTAYGALAGNLAVSEGYALAFKLLCDTLGIPCLVVPWRLNMEDHSWNLTRIGSIWYHIGIAFDDRGPVPAYDYFLLDDEAAESERLEWDRTLYPAAAPGPWSRGDILALAAEEE